MSTREDIIIRCELMDQEAKVFSDSSSQERIEIGDIVQAGAQTESKDPESTGPPEYPEIFHQLSNTPLNWDLRVYEEFLDLSKSCIREVYQHRDIQTPNETVENCFKAMLSPLRLLRFLIGYSFNISNAFSAFQKHIKWRKEFNMDNVVRPYVITNMVPNNNIEMAPLHNIITRYYPCNLLLRESTHEKTPLKDYFGNIICIERFGLLDETRLLGAVKVEELLLWYSYHMEYRSILLDKLSYEAKSLIRATCIIDLFGLSLSQVHSSHMITILRRMIQLASDNYPEGMSYVVFVNSPKFFSIVWNSFKSLLAARTVEKILVLDEDYKSRLVNIVPINNLPQFLGGLTTDQFSTVPNTGTLLLDCFGLGDDRQTLHIKRMKKEKVSISISKPNTKVFWTWGVLDGEISFSAKYITDKIFTSLSHDSDKQLQSSHNFVSDNYDVHSDPKAVNTLHSDQNGVGRRLSKTSIKQSNNSVASPCSSVQSLMNQEITLVPMSKFDSTKAYGGSYFSESPGYLVLQWDNSWSLFSGKTVHFVIKTSNAAMADDHNCEDTSAGPATNNNNTNSNANHASGSNNILSSTDSNFAGGPNGGVGLNHHESDLNDLSDISNLVSHNVALTNITKKRPSKNHKSIEKSKGSSKRNSKISHKSIDVVRIDHHSMPHVDLSRDNTDGSMLRSLKKGRRKHRHRHKQKEHANSGEDSHDRASKSPRKKDRVKASSGSKEKDRVDDSHMIYEIDSSNSECQTDSSYVTAYSAVGERPDLIDYYRRDSLASSCRGEDLCIRQAKDSMKSRLAAEAGQCGADSTLVKPSKYSRDKNLAEFEIHASRESDDYDSESDYDEDDDDLGSKHTDSDISMGNCDLILDSLDSSSSSDDFFGGCEGESSILGYRRGARERNMHATSNNKVTLETAVNIYGFENFGFESSQEFRRKQQELLNYICGVEATESFRNQEFYSPLPSFVFANGLKSKTTSMFECNSTRLHRRFARMFAGLRKNKAGDKVEDGSACVCSDNISQRNRDSFAKSKSCIFSKMKSRFKRKK
ncbi:putative Sec14d [Cryptosporidium canis]|uniref:Sec14d n=1 Tax=Cryptosporidium canis TaxID=195482 RepID=A0ABQ8P8Y2_9CRYT|nr:putative Sec14d [Cryptosporidium canis]